MGEPHCQAPVAIFLASAGPWLRSPLSAAIRTLLWACTATLQDMMDCCAVLSVIAALSYTAKHQSSSCWKALIAELQLMLSRRSVPSHFGGGHHVGGTHGARALGIQTFLPVSSFKRGERCRFRSHFKGMYTATAHVAPTPALSQTWICALVFCSQSCSNGPNLMGHVVAACLKQPRSS